MGYCLSKQSMNQIIADWSKDYFVYAPKVYKDAGAFSDTDLVRYGEITKVEEIEFARKSDYSFKEILLPISETLFFFTEENTKEAVAPSKGAIIFLRSCDLHAMKVLDKMYLENGAVDYYYQRLRQKVKFVLLGCTHSFDNCFCVDMQTNRIDGYDAYIEIKDDLVLADIQYEEWSKQFEKYSLEKMTVTPAYVTETATKITIPEELSINIIDSTLWEEYDSRCIDCGRCNFVCPTCTCFTMQDIFYTDNGKAGERRRVWASCMVDGFTDVAGGGSYRQKNGQRMRFRVLHKVYDYKKRNGYHMCVGCGRCDDICPEYISFSNCINKLQAGISEVSSDGKK